jgi:ABC-type phosphate/phosphonate transport system substrate-binding protein
MRFFKRLGLLLGLVAVLAFAVGCGEAIIDSAKTEDALEANLTKSLHKKVSSVECPSDQKVEKGATFTCTVNLTGGKTETATLKILNDDADVSVTNLSGAKE